MEETVQPVTNDQASNEAIILNNESVQEGHILEVYNTKKPKFSNANKKYYTIWVQQGGEEFAIMLSQRELDTAKYRASKNPEDVPKKGWFKDLTD